MKDGTPSALRAYVSNEDDGTVSVLDVASCRRLATIPVGKRPRGIRLAPDGSSVFVAVSGSPKSPPGVDPTKLPPADRAADGIALVALASHERTGLLPGGRDPESFDLSLDGRTLFVSNEETAEASFVDVASRRVTAVVKVGEEPEGVTVRPDGRVVYVTSEGDHRVSVIDTQTAQVVATFQTGARPRAVAFTPDSTRALVTSESGGTVLVVDAERHTPVVEISLDTGAGAPGKTKPRPMGVVVDGAGRFGYVTTGWAGAVAVIDLPGARVDRVIEGVGARPWGVALSRDGRILAVSNGPSHDVAFIDVAGGDTVRRCPAGRSPWGVALR